MIPSSYAEWFECITVKCKIPMTPDYIHQRLQVLRDIAQPETQKFAALYGEDHLQQIISWFEMAKKDS